MLPATACHRPRRRPSRLQGSPRAAGVESTGHPDACKYYEDRPAPERRPAYGGIGVVAYKDELDFEPPISKVRMTSNGGSIGGPAAGRHSSVVTMFVACRVYNAWCS